MYLSSYDNILTKFRKAEDSGPPDSLRLKMSLYLNQLHDIYGIKAERLNVKNEWWRLSKILLTLCWIPERVVPLSLMMLSLDIIEATVLSVAVRKLKSIYCLNTINAADIKRTGIY